MPPYALISEGNVYAVTDCSVRADDAPEAVYISNRIARRIEARLKKRIRTTGDDLTKIMSPDRRASRRLTTI